MMDFDMLSAGPDPVTPAPQKRGALMITIMNDQGQMVTFYSHDGAIRVRQGGYTYEVLDKGDRLWVAAQ